MQLGQALLRALADHGAREIFGIPGDFALPFFAQIEESGMLPLYTLSHEPAVGFAADAASRHRCGLGVVAVTYGAGALNVINAVASAYAEKSPLVVISGAPGVEERKRGLLFHHQTKTIASQRAMFHEVTCDQATLEDPASASAEIARVLRSCLEQSRPVYIELPRDRVAAPCAPVPVLPPTPCDAEALGACADEVLARLRAARAPVLMVGVEVRRFGLEQRVAELARRLGLPVVTSIMGRGILAEEDVNFAGTYLGVAGEPDVTDLVEQSDALFLCGVIISDTNFGVSARSIDLRKTIQALDGQVSLGFHAYSPIALGALIDALLERLPAVEAPRSPAPAPAPPHGLPHDEGALVPLDIATAVNDLMRSHGPMPIATDVGDCLFTALDIAHTALIAPGYYATMGFGVPAGMGLQAASGQRPLILVGDGAFQMTGLELGNCVRYGWDPIVIVFNNASWEMLRAFQPASRFHDLGDWRYADLAEAMGGNGVRVRTRKELHAALERAHATRGRFQLIEAMLPAGARSPTLQRFVQGVKRLHAAT